MRGAGTNVNHSINSQLERSQPGYLEWNQPGYLLGRETIPSGRRCQANVLARPKYLCKSKLLSHFAAPLRSDNGSSRNAITDQAKMHASYGITSHSTKYNGRHQGGRLSFRAQSAGSRHKCQPLLGKLSVGVTFGGLPGQPA